MPINASPEYVAAQKRYLQAKTKEDKIRYLEELIVVAPKHKGSENLLANLKKRLAKFKEEVEKAGKRKTGKKEGIKRTGDSRVVLLGMTATGKSSILSALTNAKPKIAPYGFTTQRPEVGTLNYEGCEIQIIEAPPLTGMIENDSLSLSLARDSNLILIIATNKEQLDKTLEEIKKARITRKFLIVINKSDLTIPIGISVSYLSFSAKNKEKIDELKKKIFDNLDLMRVYTKEPGRKPETRPMIMKKGDAVRKLCEKIRKDFVSRFLFAKIYGESARFKGQQVGLEHKMEDKDTVEIHLRD